MDLSLDLPRFREVLSVESDEDRGMEFLSFIEDQIRHDSWQDFHDDIFALPEAARRLYLSQCFDIGVRGDGMDQAFAFYGYGDESINEEIIEAFRLLDLPEVADIVHKALRYWRDPESPMHSDSIPWRRMDDDLGDVHGQYYALTADLFSKVGARVGRAGEPLIQRA